MGPSRTLRLFGALIKPNEMNPKATLLSLFLNATHEACAEEDIKAAENQSAKTLWNFLPFKPEMLLKGNPCYAELLALGASYQLVINVDTIFNRYMKAARMEEVGEILGLKMKPKNTIVSKWPLRLKKKPTRREFEMLYWSGHMGSERYVEWSRTQ